MDTLSFQSATTRMYQEIKLSASSNPAAGREPLSGPGLRPFSSIPIPRQADLYHTWHNGFKDKIF
jgi:hypothetical protein